MKNILFVVGLLLLIFTSHAKSHKPVDYKVSRAIIESFNKLIGLPIHPNDCLEDLSNFNEVSFELNIRLGCAQLTPEEIKALENSKGCVQLSELNSHLIKKCSNI